MPTHVRVCKRMDSKPASIVYRMSADCSILSIPQNRDKGWTVSKLRHITKDQRPVVVRGQLFYDNKHVVNDDPDEEIGGQPKRSSLWEIHPVTEFFVCMAANKKCSPQNVNTKQWVHLEQLQDR